jgi:alkylation response protein AidB-like acyl-CoA dehydrogenase
VRFAFTEQQLELRRAVSHALERECTPADLRALAGDPGAAAGPRATAGRSAERWAVLSGLGVTGLLAPEAHDGLGLHEVDVVGVLEECGRAGVPEPVVESGVLAATLLRAALEGDVQGASAGALAAHWLPRVARGDAVGTVGGIDVVPGGPRSSTVPGDGDPAGTCATPRVAAAGVADLLLLARVEGAAGWEIHAVDGGEAWVSTTPSIDPTRDIGTAEWRPSAATLLARGGRAGELVAAVADRAAWATAAQLIGLAARMIDLAVEHAVGRSQFGRPIGSFQAVKHLLADARVKLEFARPAVYRAADSIARDRPTRSHDVSMAKALASDAADRAARVALQVHGAIGYTWECDLHFFMKRAWVLAAAWGDARTHRALVLAQVDTHGVR